jgi:hypothetical protein
MAPPSNMQCNQDTGEPHASKILILRWLRESTSEATIERQHEGDSELGDVATNGYVSRDGLGS